MNKKIITLLLLFSFSNAWSAGWSGPTKVLQVTPDADGKVYVQFDEMNNPSGCTYGDLMVLDSTNPNYKLIYSSLMTAQVANLTVYYYYTSACSSSRAVFNTVKTISP